MSKPIIDLRSDTVTKPTPAMLNAMMDAKVGDDVFGEDPTINLLEQTVAAMFGMKKALFCPSGTMTNQIAIRVHTIPQDEVICDEKSHIYNYEGGGVAYNSLVSIKLLHGDRGRLSADQIEEAIRPDDIHAPVSKLVSLENTVNKGGGAFYDLQSLKQIRDLCDKRGLKLHLDGARLFNAMVASETHPQDYGALFDSISICLSKGLGAPVGSLLLLNSEEDLRKAKRIRKVFGGGMRQAGYLAAAGLFALENNIQRLQEDHQHAQQIGAVLQSLDWIEEVLPADTNIVIFTIKDHLNVQFVLNRLQQNGVLAVPFGGKSIRFVTHLEIDKDSINKLIEILEEISINDIKVENIST